MWSGLLFHSSYFDSLGKNGNIFNRIWDKSLWLLNYSIISAWPQTSRSSGIILQYNTITIKFILTHSVHCTFGHKRVILWEVRSSTATLELTLNEDMLQLELFKETHSTVAHWPMSNSHSSNCTTIVQSVYSWLFQVSSGQTRVQWSTIFMLACACLYYCKVSSLVQPVSCL